MTTSRRPRVLLHREHLSPLIRCLRTNDDDSRSAALSALVRLPLETDALSEIARESISALRERDPSPQFVRQMARISVYQVRSEVLKLLDSDSVPLRSAAAEALADVGDTSGAEVLLTNLQSKDVPLRYTAAKAAARSGFGTARTAMRAWDATKNSDDGALLLLVAIGVARSGDTKPLTKILGMLVSHNRRLEVSFARGDPSNTPLLGLPRLPESALSVLDSRLKHDEIPYLRAMLDDQHRGDAADDTPADPLAPKVASASDEVATATLHPAHAKRILEQVLANTDIRAPRPIGSRQWPKLLDQISASFPALSVADASTFATQIFAAAHPFNFELGNTIVHLASTRAILRPDVKVLLKAFARNKESPIGQQSAWLASRVSLPDVITELAESLSSTEPSRRVDAAQFVEAAAKYVSNDHGPLFGGYPKLEDVPSPAMLIDLDLESDLEPAEGRTPRLQTTDSLSGPDTFGDPLASKRATTCVEPEPPSGSPPNDAEPPGEVYARLECDDVVVVEEEFELTVGIAPRPTDGVTGLELKGLKGRCDYDLTVQVVADGFRSSAGDSFLCTLHVTDEQLYPAFILHLVASGLNAPFKPRSIQAIYSTNGQVIGAASRAVVVVGDRQHVDSALRPDQAQCRGFSVPVGPVPPDLTIVLTKGHDDGTLNLTIQSPHARIRIPDDAISIHIGDSPQEFAGQLIRDMGQLEGKQALHDSLRGCGRTLSKILPEMFWRALRTAAEETADPRPTVLLISEDPYVPWELAVVEPPLDQNAAPYLSAQTVLGRWILQDAFLPPPHHKLVTSMAVVAGAYTGPRWTNLESALEEQRELVDNWNAEKIDAVYGQVVKAFRNEACRSIIHVAVHGKYDDKTALKGLALVDGEWFSPAVVMGIELRNQPFVFLNACQVGAENELLGQYAGMASALLRRGAAGVIAPLWNVRDDIAKDIALKFYDSTLKSGASVGEAIRTQRARFQNDGPHASSSTFLAYQYFGHPKLQLKKEN